jgi:hypothetical protein
MTIKNRQNAKNIYDNRINRLLFLIFIAAGVVFRITIRTSTSFWEDEVIAGTNALKPLWKILILPIIGDMHPPLYFLQLHIWAFFSHANMWFVANSVIFSLIAMGSMFAVARRLSEASRALAATAVFSVLPVAIWMSGEVRMYAMLSVLFVWTYYFTHKIFVLKDQSTKSRVALVLLAIAIVYTHAIGFIAVFFFGLYAASWLATRRAARREWLLWLMLFGGVGVIALPMLALDAIHKADMPPLGSLWNASNWLAGMVTGEGHKFNPSLRITGLITYLIVVVAGTIVPRTRRLTLCFLVAPIVLSGIVELAARPLFKTDFFSNFFSIFFALVIGELIIALPLKKTLRSIVLCIVLAGLLTMAIANRFILNAHNDYYHQITRLIETEGQPGDVVWVPQADIFWGVSWYLAGPDWGTPAYFTEPLRPQSSWWKVFNYLGPERMKKLGLVPAAQSVETKNGFTIMTSSMNQSRAEQSKRVWLITYPRTDLVTGPPQDTLGPLHRAQSFSFPPLQVNLYD